MFHELVHHQIGGEIVDLRIPISLPEQVPERHVKHFVFEHGAPLIGRQRRRKNFGLTSSLTCCPFHATAAVRTR